MSATTNQSGYFKALNILFVAMLAMQVLFFLIVLALHFGKIVDTNMELVPIMLYLVPATTVCTILFSSSNFRKNLPNAVSKMLLQEKLDTYRSLCIKRFAILEGGTIFAIVAYFLTGHSLVACCVVAGLFMFISLRPTKEKIIQELVLSNEEAAFLN